MSELSFLATHGFSRLVDEEFSDWDSLFKS